jgi:peroxiredoxin Q/BCP
MEINAKAPDFSLPDETGNTVSLKDYRGKHVVLFFYPKANTSG